MKILFVCDTYYPHLNGVYYFVCRVGPLLQGRGNQVAVLAPSPTIHFQQRQIDGMEVYGVPSLPVLYYPNVRLPLPFFLKSRIRKIIKEFKPDIIHLQDHFMISKTLVKVNEKLKIPVIGTNHFMTENITELLHSQRWKKKIDEMMWPGFSKVYNKALLVTTPTETAARLIRPKLDVEVIPVSSGIDFKKFNPFGNTETVRKKYGIPVKPVLLFVGRIDPEKRIDEILQAVAIALKTDDFCFVIVGRGIRKSSLEKLARELNISDQVIFTGFVPDDDLPYFYKLSRCFIIASVAELLSLATLQAMATGLPVIAVNAGALGELVKDKKNGFLFDSKDIKKMVQSIHDILTQDKLCVEMSEKSLEYAAGHDINKTVESFENIYQTNLRKNNFSQLVK